MKKRYLILAGLLVMTVAAAGCGKKKTTETAPVEKKDSTDDKMLTKITLNSAENL